MAKMSLEELRKLRRDVKSDLAKRDTDGKSIQIIVGMGTCGIAAGAKNTLEAFIKELDAKGLADTTIIRQTGFMGMCENKPTSKFMLPKMPTLISVNLITATVKNVV